MYWSILAVGIGGALGSLARWVLGMRLNSLVPAMPMGTLAANLIAGYVIGLAVALFTKIPEIPPEWRLFVVTGCMGGLSTFSTFSAEVITQLQQGRLAWAALEVAVHVSGSLLMTTLGIATIGLVVR
jgi:CrcB protein